MLLLGIDIGTSAIKVNVVDSDTHKIIAVASYPEMEAEIISLQHGWAEQSPDQWWEYVKQAILKCHSTNSYDSMDIGAIGIAYQMHGLVLVDKDQHVLRNSIIWCDSRAVGIGEQAFDSVGHETCLSHLLNSPGNFTASKLAWVKQNEPHIYDKIAKVMLPGDFIAMKFTGDITTSASALSEGILWDFKKNQLATLVTDYFGFDTKHFADIKPVFSPHGYLRSDTANRLNMKVGIPVSYKAGDQPNNALSLNVLAPGEVAATAGTSGVIYGVSDELKYDIKSRINSFAHVNYNSTQQNIGILLCINGTGIFNRWTREMVGNNHSYESLNQMASEVEIGATGLLALPFGNGAERMLCNKMIGAHFNGLDFNIHNSGHLIRAVQEGIAFSFRYGLDIMRQNGLKPKVIRAAKANLFLSDVFAGAFADVNNVEVEFFSGDGSFGAAIGAGIGSGVYASADDALKNRKPIAKQEPKNPEKYNERYNEWASLLETHLKD